MLFHFNFQASQKTYGNGNITKRKCFRSSDGVPELLNVLSDGAKSLVEGDNSSQIIIY
jgi:hypothetical protein